MKTVCIFQRATKRIHTIALYDSDLIWIADAKIGKINPDHAQSQMMDAKDFPASLMPEDIRPLGDPAK